MIRALCAAYVHALEWLCEAFGHPGACWLIWRGPLKRSYHRVYDIAWPWPVSTTWVGAADTGTRASGSVTWIGDDPSQWTR